MNQEVRMLLTQILTLGFGSNDQTIASIENSGVSDAGTFVLSPIMPFPCHCWGQNPVVTGKLQLNGQDRFSEREGTYFDLVQPFQFTHP